MKKRLHTTKNVTIGGSYQQHTDRSDEHCEGSDEQIVKNDDLDCTLSEVKHPFEPSEEVSDVIFTENNFVLLSE